MQHPGPDKLFIHIGDITVSFALLELQIQTLIGSLIGEHQRIDEIITAELAFRRLPPLVNSLYLERHGDDADFRILLELMNHAGQLEEKRNQITHSLWAAGSTADTATRIKTTAKGNQGIQFHFHQVGEPELVKLADDLKSLTGEILDFWMKLKTT